MESNKLRLYSETTQKRLKAFGFRRSASLRFCLEGRGPSTLFLLSTHTTWRNACRVLLQAAKVSGSPLLRKVGKSARRRKRNGEGKSIYKPRHGVCRRRVEVELVSCCRRPSRRPGTQSSISRKFPSPIKKE